MDALRSWWEIPSIAHFCSLFRAAFQLPDFDIEDLEDGFLAAASEEGSPFLEDLICRLLQGCYGRDDIEPYNFEIYLKDIMKGLAVQLNMENPLEDKQFKDICLRQKVEILQHLCDSRLDSLDVMDQLKGFEGDNMRVEPLGKDGSGATYWYFYGSRLYKEDAEPVVEEQIKEKKVRKKMKEKDKKTKGKDKKRGRKSTRTAKLSVKRETKKATRTSSRTSTRVSSRLRALEEQSIEEDEEEEEGEEEEEEEEEGGEDKNEDEKEEEDIKDWEEDVDEKNIMKENNDEIKYEANNEIEEDLKEENGNKTGIEGEMQEGDNCESKTERQDLKEECKSESHDVDVLKSEEDKMEDNSTEDISTKIELTSENMDTPMDVENNDVKEEMNINTNGNNSNAPGTSLGLPLPEINPRWHLICKTFEDWDALAESFKESKMKCERDLCRCITQDFLPAIPEIMEAREKERKKRLQEVVPKRTSSRISHRQKELAEQEAILAEAEAEEEKQRKLEEEEKRKLLEIEKEKEEKRLREERQKNREERARRLEQREQRAQLIAEGKEIPPELQYTASTYNSKYREEEDRIGQQPDLDDEDFEEMEKVLEAVKNHKDAWPFLEPVDEEVAPGYHDVVKKPMDLSFIERKLKSRTYKSKRRFIKDFNLMCDNCRYFNGIESELGVMAQKLQRCVNKAVRVHMDKVKDSYEADEEFRIGQSVRAEKKFRPKRAASSRAMDTLHRAMNYDDDFEPFNSEDEDSDGSESPKPYRDKIVRLDPPTPTKSSRLIPELSPNVDEIGWSGEQKNIKQINKVGNPAWNIDGNVVSFNGKKLLYNFSKQNRQTSATSLSLLDAKKYSPYVNKNETKSETSWSSSSDKTEIKDTAFHQGQKFVYQVKKASKPKSSGNSLFNSNSSSPNRLLSPKGVPKVKQLGPGGMVQVRQLNIGPGGVSKVRQLSPGTQPQMIAKHGQSGGTVQIGTPLVGNPRLPMASNSVSPTGQRIIKIVAAPGQQPLQPGQVINLAELGLGGGANKAIKVSGSILQQKGQTTGLSLSGKTRIIYQGSTSVSKMTVVPNKGTPVTASVSQTSTCGSNNRTEQQTPAIITLGPSSGFSPLSANNVKEGSSEQVTVKRSFVESSVTEAVQGSHEGADTLEAQKNKGSLGLSPTATSAAGLEAQKNKDVLSHPPTGTFVVGIGAQMNKSVLSHSPTATSVSNTTSVIDDEPSGDQSPYRSSDEDIPELFPMNPPQQPPKKRKIMEGSPVSPSMSKVFIQGVSSSPQNNSSPKSPVASNSPKFPLGGLSKMNSPPKLLPQSQLGPPKLTCPPRIRSPPKTSGPPKLTPVQPLDGSNGKHYKFPPYKLHQTNGPSESRKSVFDAFDIEDSTTQDTSSEHCTKQETNSGNFTKLICDSGDRTKDSIPKDDTLNTIEQEKTSPICVSNDSGANSDKDSVEDRLRDCGSESKLETSKKSPDKGNLFDNFATFLQTPPKTTSQCTSQPVGHNFFSGQNTSSSSPHSSFTSSSQSSSSSSPLSSSSSSSPLSSSSSSSSLHTSHYSGRSIFDSISPVTTHENNAVNQPEVTGGLTQNMMDKVSIFAANLHAGSLASRLGNLSPSKSPSANFHHQSRVTQGTNDTDCQSHQVIQKDSDQLDHGHA